MKICRLDKILNSHSDYHQLIILLEKMHQIEENKAGRKELKSIISMLFQNQKAISLLTQNKCDKNLQVHVYVALALTSVKMQNFIQWHLVFKKINEVQNCCFAKPFISIKAEKFFTTTTTNNNHNNGLFKPFVQVVFN